MFGLQSSIFKRSKGSMGSQSAGRASDIIEKIRPLTPGSPDVSSSLGLSTANDGKSRREHEISALSQEMSIGVAEPPARTKAHGSDANAAEKETASAGSSSFLNSASSKVMNLDTGTGGEVGNGAAGNHFHSGLAQEDVAPLTEPSGQILDKVVEGVVKDVVEKAAGRIVKRVIEKTADDLAKCIVERIIEQVAGQVTERVARQIVDQGARDVVDATVSRVIESLSRTLEGDLATPEAAPAVSAKKRKRHSGTEEEAEMAEETATKKKLGRPKKIDTKKRGRPKKVQFSEEDEEIVP